MWFPSDKVTKLYNKYAYNFLEELQGNSCQISGVRIAYNSTAHIWMLFYVQVAHTSLSSGMFLQCNTFIFGLWNLNDYYA